jgi:glycosyltransferase involved in cell wall biosynthesis
MKVLMLSKDPAIFFESSEKYIGDSRSRHIFYLQCLEERFPDSEIKIITYTPRKDKSVESSPADGLVIYGTNSIHRAFFLMDVLRLFSKALAKSWRPDVITVQTPWEEGLLGLLLSRILCAKFVPQLHFNLLSEDWCAENPINIFRRKIAFFVLKHSTRVRVVSEELKNRLIELRVVGSEKIIVAPVGVNFRATYENKNDLKGRLASNIKNKKIILFVGRFCDQKNLELWVELAKKISEVRQDVMFVMAGYGEKTAQIKSLVSNFGISNRFIFLGNVLHADLPAIYGAADIFLLTSHYEGFGRVVLEAMLSRLPVVSTRCVGPEDLIEDRKTGYLFNKNEKAKILECLLNLLNDEITSKKIGMMAQEAVSTKFSRRNLADRVIDSWVKD